MAGDTKVVNKVTKQIPKAGAKRLKERYFVWYWVNLRCEKTFRSNK